MGRAFILELLKRIGVLTRHSNIDKRKKKRKEGREGKREKGREGKRIPACEYKGLHEKSERKQSLILSVSSYLVDPVYKGLLWAAHTSNPRI